MNACFSLSKELVLRSEERVHRKSVGKMRGSGEKKRGSGPRQKATFLGKSLISLDNCFCIVTYYSPSCTATTLRAVAALP